MRLFALTCLVMIAFAANSILGRWAIGSEYMDATGFGLLRLASGAAALWLMCAVQGQRPAEDRWRSIAGGAALTLYMIGFSVAYAALDAGLGALILFGVVQVSMFGWGIARRQPVAGLQVIGAVIALAGLAYVVWPGGDVQAPLWAVVCMGGGGLGWGIYSLLGRGASSPLAASAVNFLLATGMILLSPVVSRRRHCGHGIRMPSGGDLRCGDLRDGLCAMVPGAAPDSGSGGLSTVQLSVPVIAILAGAVILGEPIGARLTLGALVVLGGIAVVILCAPRKSRLR